MSPLVLLCISVSLAFLPIAIGAITSYVKISIVFGMLRNGFATQQLPGTLITMVLSFLLTWVVMEPVFAPLHEKIMQGDIVTKISKGEMRTALDEVKGAFEPWKRFLLDHTGAHEKETLQKVLPEHNNDAFSVVVLAFLLTELKQAFYMGFILLIPFLVIDLLTANILAGLGMTLVNPTIVSFPVKLLLFILSDGWMLLCKGLVLSYQ